EDGIRDATVTGVQTCALPIYRSDWVHVRVESDRTPFTQGSLGAVLRMPIGNGEGCWVADPETLADIEARGQIVFRYVDGHGAARSEERRVGKEGRARGRPEQ